MKKSDVFRERWDELIPQVVDQFIFNVRRIHDEDSNYYECSPVLMLSLSLGGDSDEVFNYIMNDDYWVRHWSIFLKKILIDEVYKGDDFNFNLN